jgi:cytochrome c
MTAKRVVMLAAAAVLALVAPSRAETSGAVATGASDAVATGTSDAVAAGAALFAKACAGCHAIEAGATGIGPTLAGVVGRRAGTLAGYRYSATLRAAGLTWTEATLTKYLASPQTMVPCHALRIRALVQCSGIKMTFPGFHNLADAQAVVAYLKSQ